MNGRGLIPHQTCPLLGACLFKSHPRTKFPYRMEGCFIEEIAAL